MSLDMCFFFPPGYAFDSVPYVFDTTNLVAYWKLSDASDAFGANTLTNDSITFGAGKLGNCGQFAGGNLSVADNAALSMDTNQSFFIDGWIQHSVSGDNDIFLSKGNGGAAADYEYTVRLNTSNLLVFDVSNGTADNTLTGTVLGALSLDTWHYFAAWHDAANDVVGVQLNNTSTTAAWANGCRNSDKTFYLGSRAGSLPLTGKLDDVSIWKRVLSADERAARYNSGNGREIL